MFYDKLPGLDSCSIKATAPSNVRRNTCHIEIQLSILKDMLTDTNFQVSTPKLLPTFISLCSYKPSLKTRVDSSMDATTMIAARECRACTCILNISAQQPTIFGWGLLYCACAQTK